MQSEDETTVRVLIADDDPRVLGALRAFLSTSSGFTVVASASSAPRAVELARERAPAVALVDVLLPGERDGLRLLRTLSLELRIPAVAISVQSELCGYALAAGAYRFLDKDSSPDVLLATLRAAAGHT
ncbi:response regulator transcription factor [Actinocorallia longicatena]|uniref:Response regulatory domain-containing protein n=1 Tax=Actinocorallia longicatena TaxID=111803 RepID=A0ABP6Q418_9ACTN